MNWLHSFYCVGAIGTVLAGSLALRLGLGWRAISLWLMALPALVGAGFFVLRVPPLVAEGQERMRLRQLVRKPYFLAALAAIFFVGGTELAMAQWLPAYAEKGLGATTWAGGMALLAFSVAMAAGRMAAGTVGHRVATVYLMIGSCGLAALLYLVACLAPWQPVALGACVAVGLACSCLWPSMLALTADRFPQGGASMFAVLAAFGNSGGIVLPWAVGLVADPLGLRLGLGTATLCPLLLAGILLWMRGKPNDE
jgi:fucose permease